MEKPKLKGKPKRKRHPGHKIEFQSPFPIEECIERLKAVSDTTDSMFVVNITRLYLKPIDDDTWKYEMRKWQLYNFVAKLTGNLTYRDESSTLVICHAQIPFGQYFAHTGFVIMCIGCLGLIILAKSLAILFVFAFFATLTTLNWLNLTRSRDELLDLIEETLG